MENKQIGFIFCAGDLLNGFSFYGPFTNWKDAATFAMEKLKWKEEVSDRILPLYDTSR